MDQLAKKIQENKSANSFNALKEENLDQTNLPALLDTQKIKELTTAPKHTIGPQKVKAVQEFITANAHKFDKTTQARIINLCKPKMKPTVKQMGNALKEQIQTMDEDTKIRMLNELIPKDGFSIQKIEALAKTFGLDSVFVNKSNSVQVQFALISYKRETTEIGLLDTRATENFIDSETVKKLRLGMKELPTSDPSLMLMEHPTDKEKSATTATSWLAKEMYDDNYISLSQI